VLQYETQCVPGPELARLDQLLAGEYVRIAFGNDTVAYRRDLFLAYCDHLYVEEGYPTIYTNGLKFVMRV
jgi:hypothetical protein